MLEPDQEYTTRRFQSFDTENTPPGYDAGYECELPPDVRTELVAPKRPRILGRSKKVVLEPALKTRLSLVLLVAALVIGGLVINLWRQSGNLEKQGSQKVERAKTNKAISQPLAQEPTPQPTPTPGPTVSTWREYIAQHPEQFPFAKPAPRAALVKLPPPRAQLVRVPEWRIGETRPVLMPYNLQVLATFRGQLSSIDMLPSSGNQIGDMWVVADTAWRG
jgi:hypothetical protein